MKTQEIITHKQAEVSGIVKVEKGLFAFLLIIILSFFSFNKVYARFADPVFPVKGIVIDSVTGEGISFVTIQIENNGNVVQHFMYHPHTSNPHDFSLSAFSGVLAR